MKAPSPWVDPPLDAKTAREQARRSCRYFGRVLEAHETGVMAVRIGEVTLIVARGEAAEALGALAFENGWIEGLENGTVGEAGVAAAGEQGAPSADRRPASPTDSQVTLMRHVPGRGAPPGARGNVHLHATAEMRLSSRLLRRAGEALCGKRGSNPVPYEGGPERMCGRCVEVAARFAIAYELPSVA